MEFCKIYLIRHGQSLGNQNRLYLGHTNLDLSEEGYRQAQKTADHLKNVNFDSIYSSDLLRAHNTAVPHAELRGLNITDSTELREIFLGYWENQKIDYLIENFHDDFVIGWQQNFGTFKVPGGEKVMEAGMRFYNKVSEIAKANMGKTILITAHAAVIRIFWAIINKIKPENIATEIPFPTNASYSIIDFDGNDFIPLEYSNDSHFNNKPINTL